MGCNPTSNPNEVLVNMTEAKWTGWIETPAEKFRKALELKAKKLREEELIKLGMEENE